MSVWRGVADDPSDVAEVVRLGRAWSIGFYGTPNKPVGLAPCGTLKRGKAMAEGREGLA